MSNAKSQLSQVRKRDGRIVSFDQNRITDAIFKAMQAVNDGGRPEETLLEDALKVSKNVANELKKKFRSGGIPNIEEIQDIVEQKLILMDFAKAAKAYILYRHNRALIRAQAKEVPPHVKELANQSRQYFRNPLGEFIFFRSYSRWKDGDKRRETYIETVDRYLDFMKENLKEKMSSDEYEDIRQAILRQEVMPSMRLFWSAGKAARAINICAYNCAYIAPKKLRDFGEIMYISMCGTGVGFTVEEHVTQALPQIKPQTGEVLPMHVIEDSKAGWADAFVLGLETWFGGKDVKFDYSKIRPYGSRLKTMGGRASGPGPLRTLLEFVKEKILKRQGRRLKNIDVHDIVCKIGECVEMGGVRRSAELSLSDLDDVDMRDAKKGQFFVEHPERSMANNSAVYTAKPASADFLSEWNALIKSRSGERGIFNRGSLKHQLPERRFKTFEPHWPDCGTNPCGEIILRSKEFCNLTEVVARAEDTEETVLKKIRLAAVLGTYQATLTDFPYLSKEWKENCNE